MKGQYLASYTIKILSNHNVFPPEVDTELVARIKNCAILMYTKLWSANKINAETNVVNREMLPRSKVNESYQCWRSHAAKGNSWEMLKRMDAYYQSLWEE